jgi:hypothetical protein
LPHRGGDSVLWNRHDRGGCDAGTIRHWRAGFDVADCVLGLMIASLKAALVALIFM